MPLLESFISKNRSDEYIKSGTDMEFYNNNKFPYKYLEPNKIKENDIRKLKQWNGKEIKNFIRNLAERYKIRFIEADSENSVRDYGDNSLFSKGKLNPDEWKNLPQEYGKIKYHEKPVADYAIGSRKDGNLKVNLIFSPDYGFCGERNYIYDNFMNEIKNYLKSKNIKYNMNWDIPSKNNHYRNHCNISPDIDGNLLTKLYDTKAALKNAIKNNDMVIVAGDGSNDFEMLNPLEYIEQEDWDKYKQKSNRKNFYTGNMSEKLSMLKDALDGRNIGLKQELETNGFLKQLDEIPLYGIVVKRENGKLAVLSDVFGKTGKIVTVENGSLEQGIKDAIKNHTQKSKTFANSMSENFQKNILGELKKNIQIG